MGGFTGTFESLRDRPLPAWFDEAKFGIFVHWYPSCVPAYAPINPDPFTLTREQGEFVAFTESPYSEWYVNSLATEGSSVHRHHLATYGDKPYDEFVTEFFEASQRWDPAEWADLFHAAGARYCVMGTKHLDGALLWPTTIHNPFKGPAYTSPRDIVGDALAAVRSVGLRAGVYYCGGLDITFQGLGFNSWATVFAAIPQSDEYREYADAQYRDLIARYRPDVLWNDVGYPGFGAGAAPLMAEYFNANPDGVVNDRFDPLGVATGQAHADFITPEYTLERTNSAKKFEVCRGIGTSFGYNQLEDESTYLSADVLIRLLVDTVADGGNLLLNVGPLPDGTIPDAQRHRLTAIGRWLAVNGAAIYGSQPHPTPTPTAEGCAARLLTGADGATYAVLLDARPGSTVRIQGLPAGDATLLGGGPVTRDGDSIEIPATLPAAAAVTLRFS